jgi:hypothetical protein
MGQSAEGMGQSAEGMGQSAEGMVKFASPLLNTLCCHYHEFNLASLFSSKHLTG